METPAWILAFNLINPCSTSEEVTVRSLTHCELLLNFTKEILLFSSNCKPSPTSRELLLCWICVVWSNPLKHMKISPFRSYFSARSAMHWDKWLSGNACQGNNTYRLLSTTPEKAPASGQMGWGWACAFSKPRRTTPAVCHMQEADCSQGSKFLSATSC